MVADRFGVSWMVVVFAGEEIAMMGKDGVMKEPRYGWVMVALGALMTCVAIGAMFSLAVFLQPITAGDRLVARRRCRAR